MSDVEVEDFVNENISAMYFCGLSLEDTVPDHSTLSRFRKVLTRRKAYDKLLQILNRQLEEKKIKISQGSKMVDASITEPPYRPKGKPVYEVARDRKEDERDIDTIKQEASSMRLVRKQQPGVDHNASWLRKGKKLYFGYKRHYLTDADGLVDSVHTTPANRHDSKGLKPLLAKIKESQITALFADKGYQVPDNNKLLKSKHVKNRIQHKAYRDRPLTHHEKIFNYLIGKTRYVIERTFGGIKLWFGGGYARYKGGPKYMPSMCWKPLLTI